MDLDELRVAPGESPHLDKRTTRNGQGLDDKEQAKAELVQTVARLSELQGRLWAEKRRSVLLVLQALDGGGKDGTIRSVFSGVNPQGVRTANFRAPSETERDHDYLWRVHQALPARGEIGVFNRSHYEDVLVVRVERLVPEEQWRRRYRHIAEFERMLTDEGTTVVKCYLHVSREEQTKRFRERLTDPAKQWKFRKDDLVVREKFDQYLAAYEEAMAQTSTKHAPWHVIPGDRNWVRNLLVARLLVRTLEQMDPQYPPPEVGLADVRVD